MSESPEDDAGLKKRTPVSKEALRTVFCQSKRRCCMCFYLNGDSSEKEGQIAHINRDPSDSAEANLVYLCLKHHSQYDTMSTQARRFTPDEVRHYKRLLHRALGTLPFQWEFSIQGRLSDHDAKSLNSILATLKSVADGLEISLKDVSEGSIVFRLESEERAFHLVKKAFESGVLLNRHGIRAEYVRSIKNRPADSLLSLGHELLEEREYVDALHCFTRAIELDSKNVMAWSGKGLALLELYRFEDMGKNDTRRLREAYACSCHALALCPEKALIWANKGVVLCELGLYEEAVACFDRAIQLEKNNGFAWFNQGAALYNMGMYDEAVKSLEVAVRFGHKQAAETLRIARAKISKRQL